MDDMSVLYRFVYMHAVLYISYYAASLLSMPSLLPHLSPPSLQTPHGLIFTPKHVSGLRVALLCGESQAFIYPTNIHSASDVKAVGKATPKKCPSQAPPYTHARLGTPGNWIKWWPLAKTIRHVGRRAVYRSVCVPEMK